MKELNERQLKLYAKLKDGGRLTVDEILERMPEYNAYPSEWANKRALCLLRHDIVKVNDADTEMPIVHIIDEDGMLTGYKIASAEEVQDKIEGDIRHAMKLLKHASKLKAKASNNGQLRISAEGLKVINAFERGEINENTYMVDD